MNNIKERAEAFINRHDQHIETRELRYRNKEAKGYVLAEDIPLGKILTDFAKQEVERVSFSKGQLRFITKIISEEWDKAGKLIEQADPLTNSGKLVIFSAKPILEICDTILRKIEEIKNNG
jgi:hypothetical protein